MKLFIITSRFPYPIDKGDKLRVYHQIKHLCTENEIYLYSLNAENVEETAVDYLKQYCSKIKVAKLGKMKIVGNLLKAILSDVPFQVSYFYSDEIRKDIQKEIHAFQPDVVYCQLIRTAEYVRDLKGTFKVIDFVDVISKGLERRISISGILLKSLIKIEYKRVLEYEKQIADSFDESIIITEQDRSQLPLDNIDRVKIIPNGVDVNYFKPRSTIKEFDIAFIGNLSYPPNVKASKFLVREILPLISEKYKNIRVLIAGSSPIPSIKALDSDDVKVMGWTEDIRDYYSKTRIFLAPIHLGTGLQNKLLEAMAMKIPCITSSQCQKGIKAKVNENILVANSAEEYCDAVIKLLTNPNLAEDIAENAYDFVNSNYSWRKVTEQLQNILSRNEQKD